MTTKPSLFWVDPSEFSVLLQRVGAGSSAPTERSLASAGDFSRATSSPATLVPESVELEPAVGQATLPARRQEPKTEGQTAAGSLPIFDLPSGPLEERLVALLDWIRLLAEFEHAFVVGEDGLALVHESAPLELIAASAAMSEFWDSLRHRFDLASESLLAAELTDQQHLHLISTDSIWGRLSLGIAIDAPIPRPDLAAISEEFQRTLEEEGADRP